MLGVTFFFDNEPFEIANGNRYLNRPIRHRNTPIITNTTHQCANFSHTIHRESNGKFRMWYVASHDFQNQDARYTAHSTSDNGYVWSAPQEIVSNREFSDVLHDPNAIASERYKAFRRSDGSPPRWYADMLVSSNGINWSDAGNVTSEKYGETWQPYKIGNRYALLHRWNVRDYEWIDREGVHRRNTQHDPTFVRCIGITHSASPYSFPQSRLLFTPDSNDSGETQFYAVSKVVKPGPYIAFLHRLRDDRIANGAKQGAYGTGDSVLIWSYDGIDWNRMREPFLEPNANVGSWDHAIAWIDSIIDAGNETRFYYGGYQHGHKAFDDRQIGVVKIKRNRYMGVDGVWRTKRFVNQENRLLVNIDGEAIVRLIVNGVVVRASSVAANATNRNVWGLLLDRYRNVEVQLEFEVFRGRLYSFELS